MKFIHMADIHLGSLISLSFDKFDDIKKNEVYRVFKELVNLAVENKVDFILLSGDVYDRDCYYIRANKIFLDEIRKLEKENILVYVIGGNHDPLDAQKNLYDIPSNLHIFKDDKLEIKYIYKDEKLICRIIGESYNKREQKRIIEKFNIEKSDVYTIAMLHSSLNKNDKKYSPCSIVELRENEVVDYWALGHIHKNAVLNKKPYIVYPGVMQGRDFGEQEKKGAYLVEVDNNDISTEFISVPSVIYKAVNLDVSLYDIENISSLESVIVENLDKCVDKNEKGYIFSLDLNGKGEINKILRENKEDIIINLKEDINNHYINEECFIKLDKIDINTSNKINIEDYKDNVLIETIENYKKSLKLDSDFIKNLGIIFEENSDNEDENPLKVNLDKDDKNSILENATNLIIDKILEMGE
ncbi:MAG: exonuclease SbcCD subunit D [Clostridiaceae bacterium]